MDVTQRLRARAKAGRIRRLAGKLYADQPTLRATFSTDPERPTTPGPYVYAYFLWVDQELPGGTRVAYFDDTATDGGYESLSMVPDVSRKGLSAGDPYPEGDDPDWGWSRGGGDWDSACWLYAKNPVWGFAFGVETADPDAACAPICIFTNAERV